MLRTERPEVFDQTERQTEVKMIGRKVLSDKTQAEKSSRLMGRHVESKKAYELPGIPQTIHDITCISDILALIKVAHFPFIHTFSVVIH